MLYALTIEEHNRLLLLLARGVAAWPDVTEQDEKLLTMMSDLTAQVLIDLPAPKP